MGNDDWFLHYGLDRDPFAGAGMRGLFFPGGGRQEAVDQLQHLARFGDSILLVSGPAGAGKTTLLEHFVDQCAADTRCIVVEVALLEGPEQLLLRILGGFGLPFEGADLQRGLQRLADFCTQCRDRGVSCWVVFDDAQHLHEAALALLAPLLEATSGRLRLLFFAEESWAAILRAALPATVAVFLVELSPFDRDTADAYLHYRLKTAGLESDPPFSLGELEDIHRRSAGLPGRIDAMARQLLVDELELEKRPLSTLPWWHLGVVAVTLALLGGLYAWSVFHEDAGNRLSTLQQVPRADRAEEVVAGMTPRIVVDEDAAEGGDAGSRGLATGRIGTSEPDANAGVASRPLETSRAESVAAPEPGAAPEPEPAPEPPEPASQPESVPEPALPPALVRVAAEPATPSPPRRPGRSATTPSGDERHLLALDASHYVLQVMASDDLPRLQGFAARQSLSLHRYGKLRDGRRWYALVHGDYPDQASAERAAREIGQRLGGSVPWVRRVDSVQAEIRAALAAGGTPPDL